jgi:short-subunit dehydrogenase
LLRNSNGRVVNIGSLAGVFVRPLNGIYSATKMALEAISDASRLELQAFGVSVSLVQPGTVKTAILEKHLGESVIIYIEIV